MSNEHASEPKPARQGTRTKWAFVGLVALAVGGWLYLNRTVTTRINWGDDLELALVAARDRGVPVVAQFTGPGCPFCWAMERNVLPDDEVEQALDAFVAVRIDSSEQPETAYRYGVEAIPTFVVLGGDGQVAARAEGYQSVDAFTRFLQRGHENASGKGS